MNQQKIIGLTFVAFVYLFCWQLLPGQEAPKTVLAHYMPWYASKDVSGTWGWHWTMNRFDPEKTNAENCREIASHDYPLVGPYDSNDPDLLEYHVLLMKMSGIDGVVIDWYGREPFRDYGEIHRNSVHLIKHLEKAGLRFAICYEDQAIKHLAAEQKITSRNEQIKKAKSEFDWLSNHWFNRNSYIKLDRRPVVLVFGPQHFSKNEWTKILADQPKRPRMFALPHLAAENNFKGAFGWPPVVGGKEITPDRWSKYLSDLENNQQIKRRLPVVFPGFHDIYAQAKLHESYGSIDDRDGKTFAETLDRAMQSQSSLVQIATWNDHGEGTSVEPTRNHGYRYLEAIQKKRNLTTFQAEDLRLPLRLFELRKSSKKGDERLDQIAKLLIAGKTDEARTLFKKVAADQ